ncbi:MAG: hypothetical protein R3F31_13325 [Verrucomicrobiales bacterium]
MKPVLIACVSLILPWSAFAQSKGGGPPGVVPGVRGTIQFKESPRNRPIQSRSVFAFIPWRSRNGL